MKEILNRQLTRRKFLKIGSDRIMGAAAFVAVTEPIDNGQSKNQPLAPLLPAWFRNLLRVIQPQNERPIPEGFSIIPGLENPSPGLGDILKNHPRQLKYKDEKGNTQPLRRGVFVDASVIQIRGVLLNPPVLNEARDDYILNIATYLPTEERGIPVLVQTHLKAEQENIILMQEIKDGVINNDGGVRSNTIGSSKDLKSFLSKKEEVLLVFESQESTPEYEEQLTKLAVCAQNPSCKPQETNFEISLQEFRIAKSGK